MPSAAGPGCVTYAERAASTERRAAAGSGSFPTVPRVSNRRRSQYRSVVAIEL